MRGGVSNRCRIRAGRRGRRARAGRQAQLGDPYVPPAARKPTAGTQTTGAALHAQVVRKLARQFGAADTQNNGSITEAQARAAGLGYVANHFRQIDSSGGGRVSFADVQRMQARSTSQRSAAQANNRGGACGARAPPRAHRAAGSTAARTSHYLDNAFKYWRRVRALLQSEAHRQLRTHAPRGARRIRRHLPDLRRALSSVHRLPASPRRPRSLRVATAASPIPLTKPAP
jgi:hypothetical protein